VSLSVQRVTCAIGFYTVVCDIKSRGPLFNTLMRGGKSNSVLFEHFKNKISEISGELQIIAFVKTKYIIGN
jgi:hypothetical protein